MRILRILAAIVLRGPDADLIRHDLDELYARERAGGVSAWQAYGRYVRRLAASALSLWREGRRRAPGYWPRSLPAGSTLQDLRFALRLFRKHPAPVGIAVGGLALAIGVATAVFSIISATMLQPYGMDEPESIVTVLRPDRERSGWSYVRYLELRGASTQESVRLEASRETRVQFAATSDGFEGPERVALFVSGGYLGMLGGRPSIGRALEPADDRPGAALVAVVSHHFWQTTLRGDRAVVGRTTWLNGEPVTIVGVLREGFTGPARRARAQLKSSPQIWVPFAVYDELRMGTAFGTNATTEVHVIGRLGSGVAIAAAQAQLSAIIEQARAGGAALTANTTTRGVHLVSAASPIDGRPDAEGHAVMACVFGLSGLILALACINTANLLMAAAVTRRAEIGVRLAMGATRARLVRQVISESLLLGLLAGAAGLFAAGWLVPVFGSVAQLPPEIDLSLNVRALLFTTGIAVACGLAAGLSPARHGARGDLVGALQARSVSRAAPLPRRFRSMFVGFQAAASMSLLVFAALLGRSVQATTNLELGFDPDRLLSVSLVPVGAGLDESTYVRSAIAAVLEVPGVEQASATRSTPLSSSGRQRFNRSGRRYALRVNDSDEVFLQTLGVGIVRGRTFTRDEVAASAPVALLSASAARALFPDADPIGQALINEFGGPARPRQPATIIGVVADAVLTRPDPEDVGVIYRPLSRNPESTVMTDQGLTYPPGLLIRATNPAASARAIEETIRRLDPRVRPEVSFVRHAVDVWIDGSRMLAWLIAPPALLALALATLGVLGVTAFVVSQRTEEVSVRMALGASIGDVGRLLLRDSLRPVVAGLVVGLFVALLVGRILGSHMLEISPYDPASIAAAALVLLACAVVAVAVPVRQAARTDPAGLLRI